MTKNLHQRNPGIPVLLMPQNARCFATDTSVPRNFLQMLNNMGVSFKACNLFPPGPYITATQLISAKSFLKRDWKLGCSHLTHQNLQTRQNTTTFFKLAAIIPFLKEALFISEIPTVHCPHPPGLLKGLDGAMSQHAVTEHISQRTLFLSSDVFQPIVTGG